MTNSDHANIFRVQELQDMIASELDFNGLAKLADAADHARNQEVAVQSRFKLIELYAANNFI